jgi:hypothetical protein
MNYHLFHKTIMVLNKKKSSCIRKNIHELKQNVHVIFFKKNKMMVVQKLFMGLKRSMFLCIKKLFTCSKKMFSGLKKINHFKKMFTCSTNVNRFSYEGSPSFKKIRWVCIEVCLCVKKCSRLHKMTTMTEKIPTSFLIMFTMVQ